MRLSQREKILSIVVGILFIVFIGYFYHIIFYKPLKTEIKIVEQLNDDLLKGIKELEKEKQVYVNLQLRYNKMLPTFANSFTKYLFIADIKTRAEATSCVAENVTVNEENSKGQYPFLVIRFDLKVSSVSAINRFIAKFNESRLSYELKGVSVNLEDRNIDTKMVYHLYYLQ